MVGTATVGELTVGEFTADPGATVVSAALSSTGAATVTFVGRSTVSAVLTAAGVATATFVGRATASAVLNASGSAAANFVGADAQPPATAGAVAAFGVGAANFVGASRQVSPGAVSIVAGSTVNFIGASTAGGALYSQGRGQFTAINPIDPPNDSVVSPTGGGIGGALGPSNRAVKQPKIRRVPRLYTIRVGEWPELEGLPEPEAPEIEPYDLPEPDYFLEPEPVHADDDDEEALLILALVA